MIWDGEPEAHASADDELAIRGWNLLSNGMGALDWSGLPIVCALLGVTDIEGFITRLSVIKSHRPDAEPEAVQEE